MATNPLAETANKSEAQAKLEALKQQALEKKQQKENPDRVEAYKISYDCRTNLNGALVSFKKDDIVSDPAMIKQLLAHGIDMLPISAEHVECPNCKSRFAAEIFKK